jgi:hypothetical protein
VENGFHPDNNGRKGILPQESPAEREAVGTVQSWPLEPTHGSPEHTIAPFRPYRFFAEIASFALHFQHCAN